MAEVFLSKSIQMAQNIGLSEYMKITANIVGALAHHRQNSRLLIVAGFIFSLADTAVLPDDKYTSKTKRG